MNFPDHEYRLIAYGLAVMGVTLVHTPLWLAIALGALVLFSGKGRAALVLRAVKGVMAINLVISSGYILMGLIQGAVNLDFLFLLNVRVLLLACLTAWMVRDVDLDRALYRYPAARRWLSIVRIQIQLFLRLAQDYRQAHKSRDNAAPGLLSRYRATAALGLAALDKAVHNSEEVTQGMRSRGAFDD